MDIPKPADKLITVKASPKAKKDLKLISALTGEHIYQVLDRIVEKEMLAMKAKSSNEVAL